AAPGRVDTRRRRAATGPARTGPGCRRRSRTSRSHIDRAAHAPRMPHPRARCAGKTAAWPCAHDTRHRRGRRRRFTLASPRGPEVMRLFLLSALLCSLLLAACGQSGPPPGGSVAQLERIDEVTGQGDLATPGSRVTVHYTGWLSEGRLPETRSRQLDSALDRGEPLTFVLGAGQVIRGWDDGVAGMRVGGRRILMIPSARAYGARGAGRAIPPNASLVFEVELLGVEAR